MKYGWDILVEKKNHNYFWRDGKNILVLTGGSDPTKLSDKLSFKT